MSTDSCSSQQSLFPQMYYQDLNQPMSQLRLKIQVNNLLWSRKVARVGFEPMTSSYSYWCPRPLSYQAMVYQLGFTYWFHLQCLVSKHFSHRQGLYSHQAV